MNARFWISYRSGRVRLTLTPGHAFEYTRITETPNGLKATQHTYDYPGGDTVYHTVSITMVSRTNPPHVLTGGILGIARLDQLDANPQDDGTTAPDWQEQSSITLEDGELVEVDGRPANPDSAPDCFNPRDMQDMFDAAGFQVITLN